MYLLFDFGVFPLVLNLIMSTLYHIILFYEILGCKSPENEYFLTGNFAIFSIFDQRVFDDEIYSKKGFYLDCYSGF